MNRFLNELSALKDKGNFRTLPTLKHKGKYVQTSDGLLLNLSSNDYLGLAAEQDLRDEFFQETGTNELLSSSSSRLLTGNFEVYEELESFLAERYNRQAALLFNSGYHANLGILPALSNKHTLILADKLVHASIIDGIQLSGAAYKRYKHNDYEHLQELLNRFGTLYDMIIIVTESIFSMDGDKADLKRLTDIKKSASNILLYVDEAHAVGVEGETGLGLAESLDCISDIDFLVGTFGKALGSMGAYVICNSYFREYLINRMRPLIFSTALPPLNVAWSLFLFKRLPLFKNRRVQLKECAEWMRKELRKIDAGLISSSHIIPFITGDNESTIALSSKLKESGFFALPVRPPTVPSGSARIRFSLTADITITDLKHLIMLLEWK
ncbi:MAG: 8-amino-7-oxononanoate synthase [Bacteroidales bacterium]|nr:8-amino-7-oxononanoate synthase [Bacteroidales bacterium]